MPPDTPQGWVEGPCRSGASIPPTSHRREHSSGCHGNQVLSLQGEWGRETKGMYCIERERRGRRTGCLTQAIILNIPLPSAEKSYRQTFVHQQNLLLISCSLQLHSFWMLLEMLCQVAKKATCKESGKFQNKAAISCLLEQNSSLLKSRRQHVQHNLCVFFLQEIKSPKSPVSKKQVKQGLSPVHWFKQKVAVWSEGLSSSSWHTEEMHVCRNRLSYLKLDSSFTAKRINEL